MSGENLVLIGFALLPLAFAGAVFAFFRRTDGAPSVGRLVAGNLLILLLLVSLALPIGEVLQVFWENHDPTTGMRQGNDVGTQYRSGLYTTDDGQLEFAERSRTAYEKVLAERGLGPITTEIAEAGL